MMVVAFFVLAIVCTWQTPIASSPTNKAINFCKFTNDNIYPTFELICPNYKTIHVEYQTQRVNELAPILGNHCCAQKCSGKFLSSFCDYLFMDWHSSLPSSSVALRGGYLCNFAEDHIYPIFELICPNNATIPLHLKVQRSNELAPILGDHCCGNKCNDTFLRSWCDYLFLIDTVPEDKDKPIKPQKMNLIDVTNPWPINIIKYFILPMLSPNTPSDHSFSPAVES